MADCRQVPLAMSGEEFRRLGHALIERVAEFLEQLPEQRLTAGEPPSVVRRLLPEGPLNADGIPAERLLEQAAELLLSHSLFNGHPRFWGYVTASAAPIAILSELLSTAVNPNVGAWILSPVASEMEAQSVRWISELVGYHADAGGALVSGGAMANYVGFLAARHHRGGGHLRAEGLTNSTCGPLRAYAAAGVHTWLEKAADMFGIGVAQLRSVASDREGRMLVDDLERQIKADRAAGDRPFLVVGTAGTVGTGALDPLPAIAEICRANRLWFHVDGAYGALAACIDSPPTELAALAAADSLALDPHKWLYVPLEAGCVLTRSEHELRETFDYHPDYYKFGEVGGEQTRDYVNLTPQNSRGFRALKVWLALQQGGRQGYAQMIGDDIALARELYELAEAHPELQALSHNLSITTFRYVPEDLQPGYERNERELNALNERILTRLQGDGAAFVSNAVVGGAYALRACVVNFRTQRSDIQALPEIICRLGRTLRV